MYQILLIALQTVDNKVHGLLLLTLVVFTALRIYIITIASNALATAFLKAY